MTFLYLDTSAVLKLFVDEVESAALDDFLRRSQIPLVSSQLLRVEIARVLQRGGLPANAADDLLDAVSLLDIDEDVIWRSMQLTEDLRSLDAIHLASAMIVHRPSAPVTVVTYGRRLGEAAMTQGLDVVAPV